MPAPTHAPWLDAAPLPRSPPEQKKRLKALQAVDRLESRIEKLKRVCTYNTSKVVAAYVIFNHEESYLRCLEDYEGSGWFFWRFWQPPPLRFRRLHALHVRQRSRAHRRDEMSAGGGARAV